MEKKLKGKAFFQSELASLLADEKLEMLSIKTVKFSGCCASDLFMWYVTSTTFICNEVCSNHNQGKAALVIFQALVQLLLIRTINSGEVSFSILLLIDLTSCLKKFKLRLVCKICVNALWRKFTLRAKNVCQMELPPNENLAEIESSKERLKRQKRGQDPNHF